ncbi:MAG: hypothetical protein HYV19_00195 [Gemmatimonadetes bacterium]|nr:hypothetical protein [Gemmatimonadota bacterium]
MMPLTPLVLAALTVAVLLVAAVAGFASRAARSPREAVRALARRNTPVARIAQRTGLPLDVVRTAIGTMERAPDARQESHAKAPSAGSSARPASPARRPARATPAPRPTPVAAAR